ncbi:PEP-CTERM sorting domain-containing protein [Duganella sp. BJB488]|uniref:PEP-CTERM sorting domain-containing protein n=1 Tax=unclassified Duganella TaxID=2636909 RepID=UPI000E35576C|nr:MULTISPECIES: PEP-CTERM sorting domain-containing protein [unclassified Duganella]NVD72024.1 PEP-CTERM sorting domain-containing protein [Duganella sp. BJB1802]RFP14147.1 PEP-CTERM sorting domain-containing protein [Duganella sp. BJB489]RFP17271.1 PEP-CTERM sorting domain-containing protein [Duganella sp. BJB488]RFP31940.1 PEP-CTERM sorting domain-containing protein [Duganella sp. BJB480]
MKQTPQFWPAACSMALALLCADASAGVDVTASLANFQIGVLDLTPDDGQAAGYREWSGGAGVSATIFREAVVWHGNGSNYTEQYPAAGATSSLDGGMSSAYFNGGQMGGFKMEAHMSNQFISPVVHASNIDGQGTGSVSLEVQPHTAITVTGLLSMRGRLTDVGPLGPDDTLTPYASFQFRGDYVSAPWSAIDDRLELSFASDPTSADLSKQLNYSFANNSDKRTTLFLSYSLRTGISADTPAVTPPVPEPSSYLMLGAGMLMLGAVARRRRQIRGR